MKKKMTALLAWGLCMGLMVSAMAEAAPNDIGAGPAGSPDAGSASSAAPSAYTSAVDKVQFAAEKDLLAAQSGVSQRSITESGRQEISDLILRAASAGGDEQAALDQELEELGVYRFPAETVGTAEPYSQSSSVVVNAPSIYYTPAEHTWTVATGGHWINTSWGFDIGMTGGSTIGGPDGFGVGFSSTSGTFNSRAVYSTAIMNSGDNAAEFRSVSTSNRSAGDSKNGFGFELQDFYYIVGTGREYVGTKWAGYCAYDEEFAYYNGLATSYYVHTWNKAVLNSVSFQVGGSNTSGSASIGFSIVNENQSFKAFGSADIKF